MDATFAPADAPTVGKVTEVTRFPAVSGIAA